MDDGYVEYLGKILTLARVTYLEVPYPHQLVTATALLRGKNITRFSAFRVRRFYFFSSLFYWFKGFDYCRSGVSWRRIARRFRREKPAGNDDDGDEGIWGAAIAKNNDISNEATGEKGGGFFRGLLGSHFDAYPLGHLIRVGGFCIRRCSKP